MWCVPARVALAMTSAVSLTLVSVVGTILIFQVAVFAAASEAFSVANINCSVQESLDRFRPVVEQAGAVNVPVRGYVSCVLGCPYQGQTLPQNVVKVGFSRVFSGTPDALFRHALSSFQPYNRFRLRVAHPYQSVVTILTPLKVSYHRFADERS